MRQQLIQADFQKVRSHLETKNYRAIITFLEGRSPTYKNTEPQFRAGYHYSLGLCHSKLGEYAKADDHFEQALNALPGNHQIKLEMLESYLQRGNLAEAKDLIDGLLGHQGPTRSMGTRRLYLNTGRYFKITGDYATALACYTAANDISHTNQPTRSTRDMDLMSKFLRSPDRPAKRIEGALEYAYHLLKIDKGVLPATKLALVFLQTSMGYLKEPAEKVEYLAALSQISREFRSLTDAFNYNGQAIHLDPNHPKSLAERIRLLFQCGKREEAQKYYDRDKDTILQSPKATLAFIKSLGHVNRQDLARELAEALLTRDDLPSGMRKSALELLEGKLTDPRWQSQPALYKNY